MNHTVPPALLALRNAFWPGSRTATQKQKASAGWSRSPLRPGSWFVLPFHRVGALSPQCQVVVHSHGPNQIFADVPQNVLQRDYIARSATRRFYGYGKNSTGPVIPIRLAHPSNNISNLFLLFCGTYNVPSISSSLLTHTPSTTFGFGTVTFT